MAGNVVVTCKSTITIRHINVNACTVNDQPVAPKKQQPERLCPCGKTIRRSNGVKLCHSCETAKQKKLLEDETLYRKCKTEGCDTNAPKSGMYDRLCKACGSKSQWKSQKKAKEKRSREDAGDGDEDTRGQHTAKRTALSI